METPDRNNDEKMNREWVRAAAFALDHCAPHVAAQFCAAYLEEAFVKAPALANLLEVVVSDARLWADCATPPELAAYGMAALDRLKHTATGQNTRKGLFVALWNAMPERDKQAFLRSAGGGK